MITDVMSNLIITAVRKDDFFESYNFRYTEMKNENTENHMIVH